METRQSNSCQGQVTGSHQTPSLAQCSRTDHFHQEHQISQLTQNTDEHSSIPSPACASSPSIPFGTLTVQTAFTQSRHSSTSDDVHCISKSDCPNMTELLKPLHDEIYPEGTLQLLSDLLQPGYYPPKDITLHLLKEILLNPRSPHHHCVQAFSLLMKTQRHHIADKWSISWDWEMLSNAMENKELCPRSMRMFLDYVVLTLEDDFKTKQSTSALYQSIAKAMLKICSDFFFTYACNSSLILPCCTTENRAEYVIDNFTLCRMVVLFQKMLSLALEVDCSPAICSAKLSQELFHMLISTVALRPHRMLLLESLQSKRLRCKLLEHVLDYSCPVKTSVPMSLSLLLHFLKNCTLSPDPGDGTEKWRRWEELINHLWMLFAFSPSRLKALYIKEALTHSHTFIHY
uniref:Uncharacterized protein n=1 Tax=Periophthalmus magnuspinnatus TaxID=409849 RepID=A0A3B4A9F1_9GOBI